jgi:AcrR family transcriptional regulator
MKEPTMSTSSTSRRERKKQRNRARILDAARALFQAQGYEATTVDEIAAAADFSRGTVFNYFPTKGHLLYEIAADEMETLTHMVAEGMDDVPSAVEKIRRVMRLFVADTVPFLQITRRVLLETLMHPAEVPSPVVYLERILTGLVAEAQSLGEVRADLDPANVARAVVGVYLASFFRWITAEQSPAPGGLQSPAPANCAGAGDCKPPDGEVAAMVDMLFDGIAGPTYVPYPQEDPSHA